MKNLIFILSIVAMSSAAFAQGKNAVSQEEIAKNYCKFFLNNNLAADAASCIKYASDSDECLTSILNKYDEDVLQPTGFSQNLCQYNEVSGSFAVRKK